MKSLQEQYLDLMLAASLAKRMLQKDATYRVSEKMMNHTDIPDLKEFHQKVGDAAIGERMTLQVQYGEVMRRINERFIPVELQMNNARPVTNMQVAEAFYDNQTAKN